MQENKQESNKKSENIVDDIDKTQQRSRNNFNNNKKTSSAPLRQLTVAGARGKTHRFRNFRINGGETIEVQKYEEYPILCAFITFTKPLFARTVNFEYEKFTRGNMNYFKGTDDIEAQKFSVGSVICKISLPENPECIFFDNFNMNGCKRFWTYCIYWLIMIVLYMVNLMVLVVINHSNSLETLQTCRFIIKKAEHLLIENPTYQENICYCQGLAFKDMMSSESEICSSYIKWILLADIQTFLTALYLWIATWIQRYLTKIFYVRWIKFEDWGGLTISIYTAYLRINIINFLILPVLCWADIYGWKPSKIYMDMFGIMSNANLLKDFSREWYLSVGVLISYNAIFITVLPPLWTFLFYTIRYKQKIRAAKKAESQEKAIEILTPYDTFDYAMKYCDIVFPFYLLQLYGSVLPFMYIPIMMSYPIYFIVDKHVLTKHCIRPYSYRKSITYVIVKDMFSALILGLFITIWFYGSPGLMCDAYYFKYDSVQKLTDPIVDFLGGKYYTNNETFFGSIVERIKINVLFVLAYFILFAIILVYKIYLLSRQCYNDRREHNYLRQGKQYITSGEPEYKGIMNNLGFSNILSYRLVEQAGFRNFMQYFGIEVEDEKLGKNDDYEGKVGKKGGDGTAYKYSKKQPLEPNEGPLMTEPDFIQEKDDYTQNIPSMVNSRVNQIRNSRCSQVSTHTKNSVTGRPSQIIEQGDVKKVSGSISQSDRSNRNSAMSYNPRSSSLMIGLDHHNLANASHNIPNIQSPNVDSQNNKRPSYSERRLSMQKCLENNRRKSMVNRTNGDNGDILVDKGSPKSKRQSVLFSIPGDLNKLKMLTTTDQNDPEALQHTYHQTQEERRRTKLETYKQNATRRLSMKADLEKAELQKKNKSQSVNSNCGAGLGGLGKQCLMVDQKQSIDFTNPYCKQKDHKSLSSALSNLLFLFYKIQAEKIYRES